MGIFFVTVNSESFVLPTSSLFRKGLPPLGLSSLRQGGSGRIGGTRVSGVWPRKRTYVDTSLPRYSLCAKFPSPKM